MKGLPDDPINAVREDPIRRGLLFAGSERETHVSFDDGDSWHPLRLNMPATSIRDLVIHNDDLVVGTHGRGFWILDDISPLRQLDAETAAKPYLFKPQLAYRVRRNVATDTPMPPEEPTGQNPPDGAIFYYNLPAKVNAVTLEILDDKNEVVRRYASTDKPAVVNERDLNVPTYWIRPPQILSAEGGSHRFVWDMHYAPLAEARTYPISAIFMDTPSMPMGPAAHPGNFVVRLTVDGQSQTQPLTAKDGPTRAGVAGGIGPTAHLVDAVLSRRGFGTRDSGKNPEAPRTNPSRSGPRPQGRAHRCVDSFGQQSRCHCRRAGGRWRTTRESRRSGGEPGWQQWPRFRAR